MSTDPVALQSVDSTSTVEKKGHSALQIATWFGVGVAVAAAGILVGRELRNRYRFNRRAPYDFYAPSGDYASGEYGVGF